MPGLSKKETERLLDYIEPQGVVITPVKSGFLLRLPDGGTTTIHLTGSDHRGPQNLRARLKRAGIKWPTDKGNEKIMIAPATLENGNRVLSRLGYPESIKSKDLNEAIREDGWKPSSSTVNKFMRHAGYITVGRTSGVTWKFPTPIVEDVPAEQKIEKKEEVTQVVEEMTIMNAPVQFNREFIDTHDSWTMNTEIFPEEVTVKQMKDMLFSVGLNFEIRVWK